MTKFEKLIARHSEKQLSTKELKDQQTDRVLKLVKSKQSRGKDVVETEDKSSNDGNVVDIESAPGESCGNSRRTSSRYPVANGARVTTTHALFVGCSWLQQLITKEQATIIVVKHSSVRD